jgi:hypothetical protein
VSGKILKKYREMKYISNEIKLNRHRLAKVKSKQLTPNVLPLLCSLAVLISPSKAYAFVSLRLIEGTFSGVTPA